MVAPKVLWADRQHSPGAVAMCVPLSHVEGFRCRVSPCPQVGH